jgi:photosystem II stability/assembly factor-like uncharacterized protein
MTSATTNEALDIVYALATSPAFASDGTCFAARSSGLYGSTDGGVTWRPLYGSLNLAAALPTSSVVVSPTYAADHTLFAATQNAVLRSFNGGKSWEVVLLPAPPPLIVSLAISPAFDRDSVLFAATAADGVYHSADRGNRWVGWNFGLYDLNILCLAISPDFAADETVYAGSESGVFRSSNGGRAWRELPFPPDWGPVLCLALSPNYSLDRETGVVFAGTESRGLLRSADHGQSWERVGEDAIPADANSVLLTPQFPARRELLVLAGGRVLLSRDGGEMWADITPQMAQGRGLTCAAAPGGFEPGAPLLVGLDDGTVLNLAFPDSGSA